MPARKYLLEDGTRVPGVTTIIGARKEVGGLMHWAHSLGMQGIDYKAARDAAADAGTLAHSMVDAYIHDTNPEAAVDEFVEECKKEPEETAKMVKLADQAFRSFKLWWSASKVEMLETEVPLVSEQHRFGGCLDAIGLVGDEKTLTLLDWKTSNAIYADYLIQVRAYAELWYEHHNERVERFNLARFGKEGADFHYHSWSAEQLDPAWEEFLRMRASYDAFKGLRKLVK